MNSWGRNIKISLFGASHGECVGVVLDGIPSGIAINDSDFDIPIARRKAKSCKGATERAETDTPHFISGIYNGFTTGSTIVAITPNADCISVDYNQFVDKPRPGHADYVGQCKYGGFADMRGGGVFSGRLTWGVVVASVICRKLLPPTIIANATIESIGGDTNIESKIAAAAAAGDSVGGIIKCCVKGVPLGYGSPYFGSAKSLLAQLLFSIPAIQGVEFGVGFASASMYGSQFNDCYIDKQGATLSNNAGGINGGITNGNDLLFRVAVKPTPSIAKPQSTYNFSSRKVEDLYINGRHDTCIALRMPVVIEAAVYLSMAELKMSSSVAHEGDALR